MLYFLLIIPLSLISSVTSNPILESNDASKCCAISHCKEIPLNTEGHNVFKCFKTEVCGNECSNKHTNLPIVPINYRRKTFYIKKICQLYQCEDYIYDCRKCPDPRRNEFNAYNIDSDCINCYY